MDGYNLLHAIPRFAPRGGELAPPRTALERWLAQAARRQAVTDCVLVWDGENAGRSRAPRPLTVLFTGPGVTADDRILDLCRGKYGARSHATWVVSSDHGVQVPARELGFTILGAMTFYQRWAAAAAVAARAGAGRGSGRPGGDDKPQPTRREVEELLREFEAHHDRGEDV